MGRFISRDPIGEAGGLNLYGFVGNDPVNRWGYLGLTGSPPVYIDGIHYEFYPDGSVYRYVYRPDGSGADMERVWTYAGTNQSPYSWGVIGEPGISNFDDLEEAANGSSEQTQEQTQKKKVEWKPNKKDCDALASQYSVIYGAKPGDVLSQDQAGVAGLLGAAAMGTNDPGNEYGGFVRKVDGGYTFTAPALGDGHSWGGPIEILWEKIVRSATAAYHNHPYPWGTNIFSPKDAKGSALFNLDAYVVGPRAYQTYQPGNPFQGNLPRVLPFEVAESLNPSEDYPDGYYGKNVKGSPSAADFDRLRRCKAAGF